MLCHGHDTFKAIFRAAEKLHALRCVSPRPIKSTITITIKSPITPSLQYSTSPLPMAVTHYLDFDVLSRISNMQLLAEVVVVAAGDVVGTRWRAVVAEEVEGRGSGGGRG